MENCGMGRVGGNENPPNRNHHSVIPHFEGIVKIKQILLYVGVGWRGGGASQSIRNGCMSKLTDCLTLTARHLELT